MHRQYPFSEQKQRKAKLQVKETDLTCSLIWLFPVTLVKHAGECLPRTSLGWVVTAPDEISSLAQNIFLVLQEASFANSLQEFLAEHTRT